ncbi:MAG: DNA polymerase III subunit alpha [Anaerorhabdus sp.]
MITHLHANSSYSLLDSSLKIENLVKKSKELGFLSVALCDKGVLMGAMEFYLCCKKHGIKPIIGMEINCTFKEEKFPIILLAKNNVGYKQLMHLSNKADNTVDYEQLATYNENNFIIVFTQGGFYETLLNKEKYKEYQKILSVIPRYDSLFFAISKNETTFWKERNNNLIKILDELNLKSVAINKIYYENENDSDLLQILQCLKNSKTISNKDLSLENDRHILSKEKMQELYGENQLKNTEYIADNCFITLEDFKTTLPKFKTKDNIESSNYLIQLCLAGIQKRMKTKNIPKEYLDRLKIELDVIISMNFEDYFLIVWDFIKFAKHKDILVGPGRGSASGSLVSYCLGITQIDPIKYGLLFERFLNPDRISMPDIDVDFPDDRRDEVIRYVYEKYGDKHVSHIITYGTLKAKQVIRDVGRVLEIPIYEINKLCKQIPNSPNITLMEAYNSVKYFKQLILNNDKNKELFDLALRLEGLPRHTSTHAAGVVLSSKELNDVVPTIKHDNEIVSTQYTMEYLEEIGLIKIDFLGLRNLTIIDDISNKIKKNDYNFNINNINLSDEKTFDLLKNVDTLGIFQLESSGMKNLLKQMNVSKFNDIVATIALYRPGPMENIPLYLKSKQEKNIKYLHPSLKNILEETYGVIIYQEQIMQIAQVMASFSLAKADIMRKAMSKKNENVLASLKTDFIKGCLSNGHPETLATELFQTILKFANYGFNKAHSVSYSVISYQLAYLKANYPILFYCSLLNSVIGADVKISEIINECKSKGIKILAPSINFSSSSFTIESDSIRFPLTAIKNIGKVAFNEIKLERNDGEFNSFIDFVTRISNRKVNKNVIENLIDAGAFDEFKLTRKSLMLSLNDVLSYASLVSIEDNGQTRIDLNLVSKPTINYHRDNIFEKSKREKVVLGFYLSEHPMSEIKKNNSISCDNIALILKRKDLVESFCQIKSVKKHRTKNGDVMAFVVGQDESGKIDLIFMPRTFTKYENDLINDKYIKFNGKIDKKGACLVNAIIEVKIDL